MSQLKYWDGTQWANAVVGATGAQGAQGNPATTGIVPISGGTVTATSGAFLTLDNIFTSTYRDYVLKFQITAQSSSAAAVTFQYRKSGSTLSSAVYSDMQMLQTSSVVSGLTNTTATSQRLTYGNPASAYPQMPLELKIYNPLSATVYTTTNHSAVTTQGGFASATFNAWHGASGTPVSADGIIFTVTTGTITANYQLYGVVNP